MEEEWDVLIILDGCREDLFYDTIETSKFDKYEVKMSAGSATNEWADKNFSGQVYNDTVYVMGVPLSSQWLQKAFHDYIEVWKDGFDQELGTVPSTAVTESAIEAWSRYPDKRLIVHYHQPHYPFVGYPELRYTTFSNTEEIDAASANPGANDVWEALGLGLVDSDMVWKAYAENLEYVIESVDSLLEEVDGTAVITSDHGNLFGEPVSPLRIRLYGHPPYIHHEALRHVPWAVIESS